MGLIRHTKCFLHLLTGAPGTTRDASLLGRSPLLCQIANGEKSPNKQLI